MSPSSFGAITAPQRPPRDFFALTGVAYPRNKAQNLLPFPIPDLTKDSLHGMYITPALARRHHDPLVRQVYQDVSDHLTALNDRLIRARTGSVTDLRVAKTMLQLPEAAELRYGYTAEGSNGSGMGRGSLSHQVIDTLLRVPEFAEVAIEVPDVLALLPWVSIDRMGDFIGAIAKDAVIAHTQQVSRRYFPNSACVRRTDVKGVWDHQQMKLVTRVGVLLPVADDGLAILLPHKHIVRSSPPLREEQFANFIGAHRKVTKSEIVEYVLHHRGQLRRFAEEVLKDDWRYRPRRLFRD